MPEPTPPFRDLSVVVVTYNSAAVLEDCLRSLAVHVPGAEVIVVDNGSGDDTVALAGRAGVQRVAGHGNVGFGAGVNRGALTAHGDLLLILNPDASLVAVDRAEFDRLRRGPLTGVVGARVRERDGSSHHQRYVACGWQAELYWALLQYFLVPREVALRRPRGARRTARVWIAGAAFVVGRREFLELGGFDEELFLYYEDFDLCRRYRDRGWPIRTTEAFTVAHAGQRSSPRDERMMAAYALMSLIQYVHKWHGPDTACAAAARCRQLLVLVERLGRAFRRVPVLGPRAAKKRREAELVRHAMAAVAERPTAERTYAGAAAAVRRVRGARVW